MTGDFPVLVVLNVALDPSLAEGAVLTNVALILFIMILILFEATEIPDKLRVAFPGSDGYAQLTAVATIVKRYLAIKTAVSLATGVVAAGGSLGILVPPSVIFIIYGIMTEQSIGKLFVAGIVPGIMLAISDAVIIVSVSIFVVKLPAGTLNPKVGSHITKMMRDLEDGSLKWLWVQVTNPFQSTANANHWLHAARELDNFIVVSEVYPTVTAQAADLILPTAMWVEKEGAYGNAERRTQFWHQMIDAPGESKSDLWQLVEFSKRFTTDEVWEAEILDANPEYKGKTLYEVLYANGQVDKFPVEQVTDDRGNKYDNDDR